MSGHRFPPNSRKYAKSVGRLPLSYSGFSCDFRSSYARAASHTQAPFLPYGIAVPPIQPHGSHISPYAGASSHRFSQLPHVSAAPPYNRQAPKIPTLVPTRQRFRPHKSGADPVSTNSLRRLLARYRMSRRSINPPRPAAGLRGSTHQANLLKFTAPTRGAWASGYGVASRCVGVGVDREEGCPAFASWPEG